MPWVSVIVPAYNAQETLGRTIEDILSQTYRDFELIIVDDGSKDETSAIADGMARRDDRIKVIHQPNGGQSNARNNGVKIASGDYVSFVDSDDRIEPRYLEYLVKAMKDEGADVSCAGIDRVREDYALLGKPVAYSVERFEQKKALSEMLIGRKLTVGPCCRLEPRRWLLECPFPEDKYYEDLSHTYRLNLMAGSVAYVDAPLYHYVMRSGSITGRRRTTAQQCVDYYEAVGICSTETVERYPELADDAAVLIARDYMSLYLSIDRCPDKDERLTHIQEKILGWMDQNWRRAFNNKCAPSNVHWRILLFGISPELYRKLYYIGIRLTGKAIG